MADIARIAGVSASTVSRALAGSALIPLATREHLQRIAGDMGYTVNQSARSLRLQRTETIAIILPIGHEKNQLFTDPFFLEIFGHLASEVTLRDHQVLISRIPRTEPGWLDQLVRSRRMDGVIVVGQSDQHRALVQAARAYRPMVVWGEAMPGDSYCTVGTDNHEGGRLATAHLIATGRRRIAFLGQPGLPEVDARLAGHLAALAAAGLARTPALEAPASFQRGGGALAVSTLLSRTQPFDAIFAASDVIALSAIAALQDAGLRVPQDVAVVGYDDIPDARTCSPALTSIRQDIAGGAHALVARLFARLAGEEAPGIRLAPSLVVRATCGAAG